MNPSDHKVLITGGASGIGLARRGLQRARYSGFDSPEMSFYWTSRQTIGISIR